VEREKEVMEEELPWVVFSGLLWLVIGRPLTGGRAARCIGRAAFELACSRPVEQARTDWVRGLALRHSEVEVTLSERQGP
jgi:hypothetical protein